jgi:hypothetical protein
MNIFNCFYNCLYKYHYNSQQADHYQQLSIIEDDHSQRQIIALHREDSRGGESSPINILITDLYLKIFQDFSLKELCSFTLVCRRWHQMINSHIFSPSRSLFDFLLKEVQPSLEPQEIARPLSHTYYFGKSLAVKLIKDKGQKKWQIVSFETLEMAKKDLFFQTCDVQFIEKMELNENLKQRLSIARALREAGMFDFSDADLSPNSLMITCLVVMKIKNDNLSPRDKEIFELALQTINAKLAKK